MVAIACKSFRVRNLLMLFIICGTVGAVHLTLCLDRRSYEEAELLSDTAGQLANAWDDSSVSKAIDKYREASRLWKDTENPVESAECLRRVGTLLIWENKGSDAEGVLKQALSLDHTKAGRVKTLYLLAITALKTNAISKASRYADEAVMLAERNGDSFSRGLAYFLQGEIDYRSRNITGMLDAQEKALQYFIAAGDRSKQGETLTVLSSSYVMNNKRARGIEAAEKAVGIFRNIGEKRGLALALIAYGDANQKLGVWIQAKEAFDEAENLFPQSLDIGDRAILLTKIGIYYETFADLESAKRYFQQAQRLYDLSGNLVGSSELLTVIGQILLRTDDIDEAMKYFEKSLAISRELNDTWSLGMVNERIGDALCKKGDIAAAEGHYMTALSLAEKTNTVSFRASSVRRSLGLLYENKKDFQRALSYYSSALHISEHIRDQAGVSEALYCIARVNYSSGNIDKSFEQLGRALQISELQISGNTNPRLRRTYFSSVNDGYKLQTALLMKRSHQEFDEDFASGALKVAELSRAREMLENLLLSEANFTADADPMMVAREKELSIDLNAKSDNLTELLSGKPDRTEVEKSQDEVNELQNRLEEVIGELKQKSPIYSAIKNPEPFDGADFQANTLDDKSVLLEFSLGNEESYLWVVSKSEISSFVFPARERIEGRVERLRTILKDRGTLPNETLEEYQARTTKEEGEYANEARALSDEILGQAADKIAGKRLIVVADGRLQYFPLGSLPMPGAESGEPILLTNEVVYEPSASALKIFKSDSNVGAKPTKDLLVFADPVFSKDDDRLTGLNTSNSGFLSTFLGGLRSAESLTNLQRLPASEEEAKSIATVVGAGQTTIRSGFAANRDSVLNSDITDYRVLHFATHGVINEQRPELSGIVLSIYNQDGGAQDGGFIRLQDVYGLNLHTDLVVLSACDTGIGKEVKGEGVMSLTNAFLQSGAKSVVSSLWKVDDNATKELMTDFYRGMASDGLTASAALRNAQIKMYNDPRFKSPFYWAAFTVQGDYSRVPQISRGFGAWVYVAGMFPFLLFGIYRNRRFLTQRRKIAKTQR